VQAEDRLIPDVNDEYFLYQTLVGVFPFEPYDHQTLCDRVKNYVTKAVREAKVHTAWLRPDTEYEEGFLTFIDRLLAPGEDNSFLPKLKSFQQRIAAYGIFNSLSQLLIKLTAPGVPDIYQGTELWDLSLVDPDNRRPVDFEARLHMVKEMRDRASTDLAALISDLQQQRQDGRIKLFLMMQVLAARSRYLDIFQQGSYIPIKTAGTYQDHIIAFARQHQNRVALTIVPRFLTALMPPDAVPVGSDIWQDTKIEVPNGDQVNWVDAVTQTSIKGDSVLMIGEMLQQFPGALLISQ
jgi:(1->4)-alpha-D-glucan 1-alpha-D-glucosylmutase